jgi:hypothetical protein
MMQSGALSHVGGDQEAILSNLSSSLLISGHHLDRETKRRS